MKKSLSLFSMFIFVTSLFLAGCSNDKEKSAETKKDKLTIYTTVYPLLFFTEQIGGKYVDAHTIYPPGADEHTFEPSQKDMMQLADSDLFIYIGLGLEGFVNSAEKTLKSENVSFLEAGQNLTLPEKSNSDGDHNDDHHDDINPHVWLDPIYSKDLAKAIKDELIAKMPNHKEEFENNYQSLVSDLDHLNKQFEDLSKTAKRKEFIVSHAAFGYWEERYGIKQMSISGISTSNEPTQKDLKKIISTAKKHNLKYIFFEQNVSSKLTKTVQTEMNAEPLTLHNLAVLTSNDEKKGRNYFTIMNDNIESLSKALNE